MHFAFIAYGMIEAVNKLLRDMQAQKHFLQFKKKKGVWIESQLRILPFGIYEYVFPKEDLNLVLNTLGEKDNHYTSKTKQTFLRKLIGYKKIPSFKAGNHFLWQRENVSIIPLGIKEDIEIFDGKVKDFHEGL